MGKYTAVTLDDIVEKSAPGLLAFGGCVVGSEALRKQGSRTEPQDLDLAFPDRAHAGDFAYFLVNTLGAIEIRKPDYSTDENYASFFGEYELYGQKIELMGKYSQRTLFGWLPLDKILWVDEVTTANGVVVPVASKATLFLWYLASPRIWNPAYAEKRDFSKAMSMVIPAIKSAFSWNPLESFFGRYARTAIAQSANLSNSISFAQNAWYQNLAAVYNYHQLMPVLF